MRRILILVALWLWSLSVVAGNAYVDAQTGFAFPQSMAGFTFEKQANYDDPRLGYRVDYWNDKDTLISVIVYNLGVTTIQDGTEGSYVRQQYNQALNDVERAVDYGIYQSAQKIETLKDASPAFLSASFTIVRKDGVVRRSHLFLRGQHQHFVKVRVTGPVDANNDTAVAAFVKQLSAVLQK